MVMDPCLKAINNSSATIITVQSDKHFHLTSKWPYPYSLTFNLRCLLFITTHLNTKKHKCLYTVTDTVNCSQPPNGASHHTLEMMSLAFRDTSSWVRPWVWSYSELSVCIYECVYMSVCHTKRHGVVSSVVYLAAMEAFLRQLHEGSF